ncbi:retroviral-like aspartic protease family protein [Sphingorhabdus sp. 109]|uniref:retroviral-like aspartic protease family protein n=1 Tax=Sphingorhabdus sp. 109 TaxID=2653173 RepID=UPI0012F22517|nr:retroviral-like aspartic protease family protein [Sphingorhabdus sp. 109]VWX60568.1 Aspartyl protease [Sphingorhabdus sp. 109]
MPALFTSMTPAILASALTMAYPLPLGQSVKPGSLGSPEGEIVDIEQDRAERMTVPVSIEGKGPFSFVIDTGAERSVISRKIADSLALEGEKPAELMSIAGTTTVDMVYVPRLTMGRKNYDGLISPVLAAQHIGADGILGLDGLQDQRILFDFVADQIIVEDADEARGRARSREIVVTAKRRSGQLIFTDAKIAGIEVNVIVDTGAQMSIGNLALRQRLQRRAKELDDADLLISVTGATLGAEFGMVRDFRIGRARFPRLSVAFADSPPFERLGLADKPAVLIGMDVLRKFDQVAIDFPRRKIHFLTPRNTREFVDQPLNSKIHF